MAVVPPFIPQCTLSSVGGDIPHTTLDLKGDGTGNAAVATGVSMALTAGQVGTGNTIFSTTAPPNPGNNNFVAGSGAGAANDA